MLKTVVLLNIFVETETFFSGFFEIEIFCHIWNVFTLTFYQLNATLLNKCIDFFKKKKFWPQTFVHQTVFGLVYTIVP